MALQNYSKTTWENTPSTATPLNAANLNNMENGISRATTAVQSLETDMSAAETDIDNLEAKTVLSVGSSNELVKADSSGKLNRSGAFVSNDQTKIIDNSNVEKYIPTARAIAKKLSGYVSNDDVFETLDNALSGDSYGQNMTLNLDNIVDQAANPYGHLMLYYIDSDWTRHNIFDFTEEFYTISEVQDLIDSLREFYAPRSETAPTKTVGFDADGIPEVILSATTFSGGACTNTSIKKLYVPSTVTRIDSGAFYNCTALTDVYIDNTATGITVNSSAFPSGVIVHYHTNTGRMTFNAVDELIKAVHSFEEDLANAAY